MKQALEQASPVLLEPIMLVTASVPESSVGDVMGDLSSRRGRPLGTESGADELTLRSSRHEGRTRFVDRLRARRERARDVADAQAAQELAEAGVHFDTPPARPSEAAPPEPPRSPRHVRAVPTNAELKMERALDVFNASEHVRTVGGVARSLGPPAVSVRPLPDRPSVVAISVMWELSWYRFEVDLSDEGSGVRREGQGAELTDLSDEEHVVNAAADERGGLHLEAPGE
jgi:hypothetical protein